jgi:hypothetical protein
MMKYLFETLLAVFVGLAALVAPATAKAETLTFYIQSDHPNVVELEFYSQDRNHVWPGNNEVYILDDYNVKNITLSCRSGELICYGAWVRNRSNLYWGVGPNDSQSCSSCCYYCDGGYTETIGLDP